MKLFKIFSTSVFIISLTSLSLSIRINKDNKSWQQPFIDDVTSWTELMYDMWGLCCLPIDDTTVIKKDLRKSMANKAERALNKYPYSSFADDLKVVIALKDLDFDNNLQDTMKTLEKLIEQFKKEKSTTILRTLYGYDDNVSDLRGDGGECRSDKIGWRVNVVLVRHWKNWAKYTKGSRLKIAEFDKTLAKKSHEKSIQMYNEFMTTLDRVASFSNPDQYNYKSYNFMHHLHKYPVFTADVATVYLANCMFRVKKEKRAVQLLEEMIQQNRGQDDAIHKLDMLFLNSSELNYHFHTMRRPVIDAYWKIITHTKEKKQLKYLQELIVRFSPNGLYYELNEACADFAKKHNLSSKFVQEQYQIVIEKIKKIMFSNLLYTIKRHPNKKLIIGDNDKLKLLTLFEKAGMEKKNVKKIIEKIVKTVLKAKRTTPKPIMPQINKIFEDICQRQGKYEFSDFRLKEFKRIMILWEKIKKPKPEECYFMYMGIMILSIQEGVPIETKIYLKKQQEKITNHHQTWLISAKEIIATIDKEINATGSSMWTDYISDYTPLQIHYFSEALFKANCSPRTILKIIDSFDENSNSVKFFHIIKHYLNHENLNIREKALSLLGKIIAQKEFKPATKKEKQDYWKCLLKAF